MPPTLPHVELTGWMVRPMDVGVTVHAGSTEHAVALVRGDFVFVIDRCRMLRRNMTALTEHRHSHHQHAVVRRAMRVVTGGAALSYRRVLPEHRTPHFRVAADTEFGDRASGLQVLHVADRSVRVMT